MCIQIGLSISVQGVVGFSRLCTDMENGTLQVGQSMRGISEGGGDV